MNLILFSGEELLGDGVTLDLRDRRFHHLRDVQKVAIGDEMIVGQINGDIGKGGVVNVTDDHIRLSVTLTQPPPPPAHITLLLALPRPKTLKRMIITATTFGIKRIYLVNSWRVDKSYWKSPVLDSKKLREYAILGLEQARDTVLPVIEQRRLFKPFVEDELPGLIGNSRCLVAHPYAASDCPRDIAGPVTLAIGPEGGLIDYEVEKLSECGFRSVTIGSRILRVDAAVPALLSRLIPRI